MILWCIIVVALIIWNVVTYFVQNRETKTPLFALLGFLAFSAALAWLGPNPTGHD